MSRPSPPNASAATTTISASVMQRSAHRHAEQQRRAAEQHADFDRRAARAARCTYDARYCARDIGVATSRLSRFLPPLIDDREAESPDAAAHDRHAEQTGHDEVDVARAALANVPLGDRQRIGSAGAALHGVVRRSARGARVGSRVVELVLHAPDSLGATPRARRVPCAARRPRCRRDSSSTASAVSRRSASASAVDARTGPSDRDVHDVGRLAAERDAETDREQNRKAERPEQRLRLAHVLLEAHADELPRASSRPCAWRSLIAKLPPGERHEHVLERRRVRRRAARARARAARAARAAPARCDAARSTCSS